MLSIQFVIGVFCCLISRILICLPSKVIKTATVVRCVVFDVFGGVRYLLIVRTPIYLYLSFVNKNNCLNKIWDIGIHCVKSVQIRSYFWSVFSCIRLNTEIYSVNLRIQSEYRQIRIRNNSVSGYFSCSDCSIFNRVDSHNSCINYLCK